MMRERTQSWEAQQWESAKAYWPQIEPTLKKRKWLKAAQIAASTKINHHRVGVVLQWAFNQRLIERRYVDARTGRVCHASGSARAEWRRANNSHE